MDINDAISVLQNEQECVRRQSGQWGGNPAEVCWVLEIQVAYEVGHGPRAKNCEGGQ